MLIDRDLGDEHTEREYEYKMDTAEGRWGVRTFETGATRDTDDGKFEYAGFLDPHVLRRFAAYMHEHRIQSDGTLRSSSNWKKGIPMDAYMQSGFRHFMDWWTSHEDRYMDAEFVEEALCALMFNVMGYLREFMLEYGD